MKQSKISFKCPSCGKESDYTVYTEIDSEKDAELAALAADGSIFKMKCGSCGHEETLSYATVYINKKKNFMVSLVPGIRAEVASEVFDEQKRTSHGNLLSKDYLYRMTPAAPFFAEKVRVFETGRDDRVIELCKYFVFAEVMKQMPSERIVAVFYNVDGDEEKIDLVCEGNKILRADFNDGMYTAVKEKFENNAAVLGGKGPFVIDNKWAADIVSEYYL